MTADWMTHAACKGIDLADFFPDNGHASTAAVAACQRCPVAPECHDFAEDTRSAGGYWAGHRRNENGTQSRQYAAETRERALELWRAHRKSYSSDTNAAAAVARAVTVDDARTVLTWVRAAGLAKPADGPAHHHGDTRQRAIDAYRQQRADYPNDTNALDAIAAQHGISRTTLRTWTRQADYDAKATQGA